MGEVKSKVKVGFVMRNKLKNSAVQNLAVVQNKFMGFEVIDCH